jgi:predicted O-methyltransferase YrrM
MPHNEINPWIISDDLESLAIAALKDSLACAEMDSDRINAAKALLQHVRAKEKANRLIKGDDLVYQKDLFGSWDIKKPGDGL